MSDRYTKSGECVNCVRGRARSRRLDNPEATRAYDKAYGEANREARITKNRLAYHANREQIRADGRAKTAAKPGWRKDESRRYYEKYREKVLARTAADRPKFRARDNHLSKLKKARKFCATPAWADLDAIKAIYAKAEALGMHVDHVIPLRGRLVCGMHVENNLQPLDPVENMKKHNCFNPVTHIEPLPAWMIKNTDGSTGTPAGEVLEG